MMENLFVMKLSLSMVYKIKHLLSKNLRPRVLHSQLLKLTVTAIFVHLMLADMLRENLGTTLVYEVKLQRIVI